MEFEISKIQSNPFHSVLGPTFRLRISLAQLSECLNTILTDLSIPPDRLTKGVHFPGLFGFGLRRGRSGLFLAAADFRMADIAAEIGRARQEERFSQREHEHQRRHAARDMW